MSQPRANERGSIARRLKYAGMAIIALLVLIIVLQNTESVRTDLLFVSITMPRAVLLFVTFLIGFLLGLFVRRRRG
jgi:uncharacterized integral membrane protein